MSDLYFLQKIADAHFASAPGDEHDLLLRASDRLNKLQADNELLRDVLRRIHNIDYSSAEAAIGAILRITREALRGESDDG